MKLTASGVANCAAIVRSPSFSRSAASTTTTNFPWRMSSIASSIVAKVRCSTVTALMVLALSRLISLERLPDELGDVERDLDALLVPDGVAGDRAEDPVEALVGGVVGQVRDRRAHAALVREPVAGQVPEAR